MYFNYQKEKAKFIADWAQEEKLLRSNNVSEEIIAEIYRFSLQQFNSYRRYYRHKEDLELIVLYAKGYTEKEIALRYGQTQSNISQKITRIKKYLKKFL